MWNLAVAAGTGLLLLTLGYVFVRNPSLIPPEVKLDEKKIQELMDVKKLDFDRGVIVHLFEWPYEDIAKECENFLAKKGYAAVQISPPTEHRKIEGDPWYDRYQVVSYKLESRSGTRAQLEDMVKRCNNVGVRVFAEVVINHMTSDGPCKGVSGTPCNPEERVYQLSAGGRATSNYTKDDFHYPRCDIKDMNNATELRVCELYLLHDLDQGKDNVRKQIVKMMNDLINIGVAGFRINAAMNIWPDHLFQIYSYLTHLNTNHGFPRNTRPFVYQEVIDLDYGAVKYTEYTPLGLITDARYSMKMSEFMGQRKEPLSKLKHFGSEWIAPSDKSVVFVDDYSTERSGDVAGSSMLNYKQSRAYKMAVAFMLARGHGTPVVMSSFKFANFEDGPPKDAQGKVVSPSPNAENICNDRWACQHRWRQIYNMVTFHEATKGQNMTHWWINDKGLMFQFNMGKVGTIAFNFEGFALSTTVKTELPPGEYCDIISGVNQNGVCTGRTVEVLEGAEGAAHIHIEPFNQDDNESDGVFAILDHKISRKF